MGDGVHIVAYPCISIPTSSPTIPSQQYRADWPGLDNAILPPPYQTQILLDSKSGSSCYNNNNNNNLVKVYQISQQLASIYWTLNNILLSCIYFSNHHSVPIFFESQYHDIQSEFLQTCSIISSTPSSPMSNYGTTPAGLRITFMSCMHTITLNKHK